MFGKQISKMIPSWKRHYFECGCKSEDHTLIIDTILDPEFNEFNISHELRPYAPWYKRVLIALKYIFNNAKNTYFYDVTSLEIDEVKRLKQICQEYLDENYI